MALGRQAAPVDDSHGVGDDLFEVAREVVYGPVASQSLVELTVSRLRNVVSLGLIEVGAQLPSEPELAERLGVSAATLREALAVLRGAGLVQTRRGRGGGSFIARDVSPLPPEEARRRLAGLTFDAVRDLGEYHAAIAGRAAALAAERATPSEGGLLESLVQAMGVTTEVVAFSRLDAQLHIGIAGAARSSRLTAGETDVQGELTDFISLIATPAVRLRLSNSQHEQIVSAIVQRDATRALNAAEWHAQTVTSLLIEARSEIVSTETHRSDGFFSGLQPYGSGAGSSALELLYDPITALSEGARADARRKRDA